jgi:quinone-modifying oxidoreductase subunit QmoC
VLAAVRAYTVSAYARPKILADMLQDPKKLPILAAIPVVIFLVLGLITGLLDLTPGGDEVVQGHFVSTWLVDMIMIPTFFFAVTVFALGLKDFINDVHATALRDGKTVKQKLDIGGVVKGVITVLPTILKHSKFSECTDNRDRSTAHLMVFYSFIGLFIVTNCFFVAMYVLGFHGPYSQLNPIKWLGNISGVALIIGSGLLIKNRLGKKDQVSSYVDWYLLCIVFGLGLTGMGTQLTRLADLAFVSYFLYAIHLILIFMLFAFTPFSKLAHLVYRTAAMGYNEWAGRK